jgi:ABC-type polysaccharide/polyol phosphate transport system ATPase subunit
MDEIAISVNDVSMMFNLSRDKVLGIKEYVIKALQRKLFFDEFWALRDISFDVKRGEVVGIVGLNGSGKSTLLKIIAGVFKPTNGSVMVKGEIAPLLELGTGFDPEFSARDNVYMNGAMFGYSPAYMKEIYEEIMDFAELWEFENVPMKNFSSGMIARLGFSVATCVEPEILIADEILSVGDFRFGEKCNARINEMIKKGTTVLIVSHSIDTIKKMCSRAVLLEKGKMICVDSVKKVCEIYQGEPA